LAAIFITGTGTNIGKTFIAAGLIRYLRRSSKQVHAFKPVVSGFDERTLSKSDPGVLLRALGRSIDLKEIARISPWRFGAPLSPDQAARREGRSVDFGELVVFSREVDRIDTGVVLIEGVGGVMVPLNEQYTVLDWMTELRAPLIVVTGTYLGAISHTLSAIDVIVRRELLVAALVINESLRSTVPIDDTAETMARFIPGIDVVTLPRLGPKCKEHAVFGQIFDIISRIMNLSVRPKS